MALTDLAGFDQHTRLVKAWQAESRYFHLVSLGPRPFRRILLPPLESSSHHCDSPSCGTDEATNPLRSAIEIVGSSKSRFTLSWEVAQSMYIVAIIYTSSSRINLPRSECLDEVLPVELV